MSAPQPGSLVLYKIHPAIVRSVAEKIEIEMADGKTKRVREKDVEALHPGPVASLDRLDAGEPALEEAWELLEGETVTLEDLAGLLFGDYSPATAWGAWQVLHDGLYFDGKPTRVIRRDADAVAAERAARVAKQQAEQAWAEFLARVEAARLADEDVKRLAEVERVALGASQQSRILAHFDLASTPETAHRFLVRCGYWAAEHNPWPARVGVATGPVEVGVPELPDEPRRDLTGIAAWAIDDAGNQDPDDAIGIDGDRLWVHIADVAALVRPDGHLDQAARERAANLYLPEFTVGMLPDEVTERLGLGLAQRSPALSISFRWDEDGFRDIEITPSWIHAKRVSYDAAEALLDEGDLEQIRLLTDRFRAARQARGAARIDLPEVSVRVVDDVVEVRPLARLRSREMVADAMLMAGEAVAIFCSEHDIAIPYAMQPAPDEVRTPDGMAAMYAYRRLFKPSRVVTTPEPHFGLGLQAYTRVTSPLRRYSDLVVHQQLRAFLCGSGARPVEAVEAQLAGHGALAASIRRAERQSNLHWKLVLLSRHSGWRGEAVVVALEERKAVIIVPSLGLETRIRLQDGLSLDQRIEIGLRDVDLPDQQSSFRVIASD